MAEALLMGIIASAMTLLIETGQELTFDALATQMNKWKVNCEDGTWTGKAVQALMENMKSEAYSSSMMYIMAGFIKISNMVEDREKIKNRVRNIIGRAFGNIDKISKGRGKLAGVGRILGSSRSLITEDVNTYYMNNDLNLKAWTLGSDMSRSFVTGRSLTAMQKISVKKEVQTPKIESELIKAYNNMTNAMGWFEGDKVGV